MDLLADSQPSAVWITCNSDVPEASGRLQSHRNSRVPTLLETSGRFSATIRAKAVMPDTDLGQPTAEALR